MAVLRLDILRRAPYADGQEFGETGAYERIDGLLTYAVDPEHQANRSIVDLHLAPRNADGLVEFSGDFCLLQPADPSSGNRRLFLEIPNRGRKLAPATIMSAPTEVPPTGNILPGNGFFFRHGYSVAWIGWQWDVVRSEALMGLAAPQALADGRPISGQTICRFQPNADHNAHLLADRIHIPYSAADLDDPTAVLTIRDYEHSAAQVIPRDQWRFAKEVDGRPVADPNYVYLESGFKAGKVYELVYTTNRSPVVGVGLLAVRDAPSFLHYSNAPDNPAAGRIDYVYGFGMSQTGRLIRHFLSLGLNVDEQGRIAYDGLIPHVAGARRGEFNNRFAQPSVQASPGFGHLPPFTDQDVVDIDGTPMEGLLTPQRRAGGVPKVFHINTSAEYWRGDCALLHIDPSGSQDLPEPAESRIYLLAGTQHMSGKLPLTRYNPNDGAKGRYDFNVVDYSPLLRAAVVNLDRWVSEGVEPPPSQHPRFADGSAVTRATVLQAFATIPGMHLPNPDRLPILCRIDLGPEVEQGVGRFPAEEFEPFPALVSAVDQDGNEVSGIRLPDISVPISTLTGWNPRDPETGSPDQVIRMQGSTHFFAKTEEERAGSDDPRPSIAARYASRATYLEEVRSAAVQLVNAGYLLDEDVPRVVENAAARYDLALSR